MLFEFRIGLGIEWDFFYFSSFTLLAHAGL